MKENDLRIKVRFKWYILINSDSIKIGKDLRHMAVSHVHAVKQTKNQKTKQTHALACMTVCAHTHTHTLYKTRVDRLKYV